MMGKLLWSIFFKEGYGKSSQEIRKFQDQYRGYTIWLPLILQGPYINWGKDIIKEIVKEMFPELREMHFQFHSKTCDGEMIMKMLYPINDKTLEVYQEK